MNKTVFTTTFSLLKQTLCSYRVWLRNKKVNILNSHSFALSFILNYKVLPHTCVESSSICWRGLGIAVRLRCGLEAVADSVCCLTRYSGCPAIAVATNLPSPFCGWTKTFLVRVAGGETWWPRQFSECSPSGGEKNISELQIRCVKWTSIDSICVISSPNHMFDHMLELSRWDDSNKCSNIGFGEEMDILEIKIRTLSGADIF